MTVAQKKSTVVDIDKDVLSRLASINGKKRLAHAYLFIGPRESGKSETALAVAKMLNCEQSPGHGECCNQCSSCAKINSGNHPDVHVLANEPGETIKIDQVRDLSSQTKLRPYFSEVKVFIVKEIEYFTDQSANALLKTLEEPSASSLILLTTSRPEHVLDTVKSRCHTQYFHPLPKAELAQTLVSYYDEQDIQAHVLAHFSEGCLGTARRLSAEGFFCYKNDIIDRFILAADSDAYVKKLLSDKEQTKVFLAVLLSWIRDALLVQARVEDARLIHKDRVSDLKLFQKRFSFDELNTLKSEVVNMNRLLADNLNIKIPVMVIKEQLWAK